MMTQTKGQTIIIHATTPFAFLLKQQERLLRFLRTTIEEAGLTDMNISCYTSYQFPHQINNPDAEGGVSAIAMGVKIISESHINAMVMGGHGIPEDNEIHIDLSSCRKLTDNEISNLVSFLKSRLKADRIGFEIVNWDKLGEII